jgi:hypothetical protein
MTLNKVYTRRGGVSQEPFDSLNARFEIGDNENDVIENRRRICSDLKINHEQLVSLNQIHSDRIVKVRHEDYGEIDEYDGMIANIAGKFLMIQVADCQAVMLWDEKNKVIANLHNGWKGSAKNITGKCIRKMKKDFGCDPKDINIEISPSLGPCHSQFSDPYNELPEDLHKFIKENNHVDFWKVTKEQCINEGIPKSNIKNPKICTVCNNHKYFSYRSDISKNGTGRFAVIIGMY